VSTEQVVASALAIADAEGLAALTMRRLAADLGIGVMTLYGHVRTKEELIEKLTELAIDDLRIPAAGRLDEQLVELFTNLRELLWLHPSVLYADTLRPLSGPAALRAADAALAILRASGLDGEAAVTGLSTLISYTFGSALFRLNQAGEGRPSYELHVRGADPAALPNVSSLAAEMLARGSDHEFDAGLRLIVDGLAHQAERKNR
jgi:AcrR family transcriptional regulator